MIGELKSAFSSAMTMFRFSVTAHSPQPFTAVFIIRQDLLNLVPELPGMVRLADMNQFMHHNVIHDVWRCLDQAPAEIEPSFVGA